VSERTWLYGLTADEWFHLASEGEQSEVAPCCGNLGELRDLLRELMIFQPAHDLGWRLPLGERILLVLDADGDGHGLQDAGQFPLLHKVIAGIRADQAQIAAERAAFAHPAEKCGMYGPGTACCIWCGTGKCACHGTPAL
jgi:hypothetical protein